MPAGPGVEVLSCVSTGWPVSDLGEEGPDKPDPVHLLRPGRGMTGADRGVPDSAWCKRDRMPFR